MFFPSFGGSYPNVGTGLAPILVAICVSLVQGACLILHQQTVSTDYHLFNPLSSLFLPPKRKKAPLKRQGGLRTGRHGGGRAGNKLIWKPCAQRGKGKRLWPAARPGHGTWVAVQAHGAHMTLLVSHNILRSGPNVKGKMGPAAGSRGITLNIGEAGGRRQPRLPRGFFGPLARERQGYTRRCIIWRRICRVRSMKTLSEYSMRPSRPKMGTTRLSLYVALVALDESGSAAVLGPLVSKDL